jgi:hypothetical protein
MGVDFLDKCKVGLPEKPAKDLYWSMFSFDYVRPQSQELESELERDSSSCSVVHSSSINRTGKFSPGGTNTIAGTASKRKALYRSSKARRRFRRKPKSPAKFEMKRSDYKNYLTVERPAKRRNINFT